MKAFAKELRKQQTDAERILWQCLRNRSMAGYKFRRQEIIGNYIVDFLCLEKKLIIELDGSQHMDMEQKDRKRTQFLESLGYIVIRFWNNEIMGELDSVKEEIFRILDNIPSPQPSPEGRGG